MPGYGLFVKVIVAGAGIGGLTAAVALRRVGVEVTVFEHARELREIGAGIVLWANAMKALGRLQIRDAVREFGWPPPLRLYEARRAERTASVVRRSRLQGRILQLDNPLFWRARNAALRTLPGDLVLRMQLRSLDPVAGYEL